MEPALLFGTFRNFLICLIEDVRTELMNLADVQCQGAEGPNVIFGVVLYH